MTDVDPRRARSFGAIAAEYDRLRPRTPLEAIRWLLPAPHQRVVDLAAGTGATTEGLLQPALGITEVIAVEPDDRMRAVLADRLPGARAVDGTAESIPLPDAYADAVLVSSAWHWFDHDAAFAEIARVLRDGGVLGVLWNTRDASNSPWLAQMHQATRHERPANRADRRRHRVEPPTGAPFEAPAQREFRWSRAMSPDDVVALLGTFSGMLVVPDDERAARLAAARDVLAHHPDVAGRALVDVPHRTSTWRLVRRPRT